MIIAWGHLPNATHIDQALLDIHAYPDVFADAWLSTRRSTWDGTWWTAWAAARSAVLDTERSEVWAHAWTTVRQSVLGESRDAALGAIVALVAYDHAAEYLPMSTNQSLVWGELRGDPAYVLLKPYLTARAAIVPTAVDS
jgi:hypothetical protein